MDENKLDPRWQSDLDAQCWLWKDHTSWREAAEITLVNRHAPFTWGKTVAKAVAAECIARMALLSLQLVPDLSEIEPEFLKKHFERKHGASAYYGQ